MSTPPLVQSLSSILNGVAELGSCIGALSSLGAGFAAALRSGVVIPRYATPGTRQHARDMLMGSQTMLDWTSAATITRRFETFLQDKTAGLYVGVASGSNTLGIAKELRNHIAHNSDESGNKYQSKVIAVFYPTAPIVVPSPGAMLAATPKVGPAKGYQVLTYFREKFLAIAASVAAVP